MCYAPPRKGQLSAGTPQPSVLMLPRRAARLKGRRNWRSRIKRSWPDVGWIPTTREGYSTPYNIKKLWNHLWKNDSQGRECILQTRMWSCSDLTVSQLKVQYHQLDELPVLEWPRIARRSLALGPGCSAIRHHFPLLRSSRHEHHLQYSPSLHVHNFLTILPQS